MCGIFFYTSTKPITGRDKKRIEKHFDKIKHRGPDASQVRYYNDGAMAGFKRLSIVDPTGAGMQPFEDSRYICMVNGEIYNYRQLILDVEKMDPLEFELNPLTSHSDCEVVLHLFKAIVGLEEPTIEHAAKLAQKMDGEFAFIIYDTKTGTTFYGVDELRARPLFIGVRFEITHDRMRPEVTREIVLASEQKALVGLVNSIQPVRSGSVGSFTNKIHYQHASVYSPVFRSETRQYYDFDLIRTNLDGEAGEAYRRTTLTFEQSMEKLRTMIIDNVWRKLSPERDFGFLLSGGLDSSLVCGIAAQLLAPHRIRTFTVGFDKNAPDVIAARVVAKYIDSIHSEFIFTYEDGIAILPEVIYNNESWDQTTTRASVPMTLAVRSIKKQHPEIAVIYSGEMADELFMGYLEWQSAPDPKAAREHVIKRLQDITYFDGLRADRTVCAVGCELRLPFFGKDILDFVLHMPPEYLMPQMHDGVEKYILRQAFSGTNSQTDKQVIPSEILWRTKHAFSDATSIVGKSSWKEAIRAHADREITDSRFVKRDLVYPDFPNGKSIPIPQTKEDMLYREIFDSYGFEASCIPYKWMPNWAPADLTDASATALAGFTESRL